MPTYDDSLATVRLTPAFSDSGAVWRARNDAGLALARVGRWPDALEAFSGALMDAPCFADAPDVHALLHGNRAQAHFHCGELQRAVASARRALAARLVCGDESDAPVARMRADLGVYLAACGEVAEAERSLHDARTSLERRGGKDDLWLASVLENQAWVQLIAHRAAMEEPLRLLLRARARRATRALATDSFTPVIDALGHTPESEGLPDDTFELIDADEHPPVHRRSPHATRTVDLVGPGTRATPQEAMQRAHPLGFDIQYGIPQEPLLYGDTA